jgi:ribosomal protein L29
MFNPLVDDMSELTDNQVEEKVNDLSKKYFQTRNMQVRDQIASVYEMYKLEAQSRRAKAYQRQADNNDNDLDNLININ